MKASQVSGVPSKEEAQGPGLVSLAEISSVLVPGQHHLDICFGGMVMQVLQTREGSISIKELSDMTAIKTDDIISTLQHLNLIQYQKGQHVICAAPSVIDRTLKAAGSPGLEVRPICCPV